MLILALPVILTYLGIMLMGIVDLVFVGRVSASAMGAVGVGTSIFTWFMIFGIGLLAGLDYLVAFAEGAQRPQDGHRAMVQSLIATTLLSIPLTLAIFFVADHLDWLGVNAAVLPEARSYLQLIGPSLWPTLIFNANRQYLTAMNVAIPGMIVLFIANLLNALINYALVLGRLGAPAWGANGSAVATLVSRFAMMVAMSLYLLWWDRRHADFFRTLPFRYDGAVMREFLKLGLPSALQMTFEVGVFALSTTLAARLTAEALAAHQIVLNIASLTFMVPLGLSAATAILVGQALGRGDPSEAARMGWRGLAMGVSYMATSAAILFFFSGPILALFTSNETVIALASKVILIVALFQLSDGTQVVATGALRGLGDTRSSMIGNLFGHWAVGFPVGLYLCFYANWGIQGLWTGLSLGLTTVAAILLMAWRYRINEKLIGSP